jgi:hypothetical protein
VVLVGTGNDRFEELEPEGGVYLYGGPQGSFHIWVSVRSRGFGNGAFADYGVRDAETDQSVTWPGLKTGLELNPRSGWHEIIGIIAQLYGDDASPYVGRDVRMWATVEDDCGRKGRADGEATVLGVRPWDHPAPGPP